MNDIRTIGSAAASDAVGDCSLVVDSVRAQPAADPERIVPIDVLRGFALLGILVMNIQSFAMPDAAYMNPTAYGDLSGANFAVWLLSHVFADQKFMTIFSMLFGAGIVLMTSRAEARQGRSAALHYRRMGALWVIGMLHAYLLWYGDILYSYAMCGLLVYLFRNFRPRWLMTLGLISITIPAILSLLLTKTALDCTGSAALCWTNLVTVGCSQRPRLLYAPLVPRASVATAALPALLR